MVGYVPVVAGWRELLRENTCIGLSIFVSERLRLRALQLLSVMSASLAVHRHKSVICMKPYTPRHSKDPVITDCLPETRAVFKVFWGTIAWTGLWNMVLSPWVYFWNYYHRSLTSFQVARLVCLKNYCSVVAKTFVTVRLLSHSLSMTPRVATPVSGLLTSNVTCDLRRTFERFCTAT